MDRKLVLGLGLSVTFAVAAAQVGAPPSSSSPNATPPGAITTPATPATELDTRGSLSTGWASAGGTATFSSIDKNADGKISRTEAHTDVALTAKFKNLDADNNNALSMSEYANYTP